MRIIGSLRSVAGWTTVLLAFSVFVAAPAKAATVDFDFSYSGVLGGNPISGSGTITATDDGGGQYTAISGSGTSTEAGALVLLAAGTYTNTLSPTDNLQSDNLLFPGSDPVLTGDGLVFQGTNPPLDPNSLYVNIWGNGPGNYTYFNNYDAFPNTNGPLTDFQLSISEGDVGNAPLPAALPLFGTGLGALGLLGWRRKRKAALSA